MALGTLMAITVLANAQTLRDLLDRVNDSGAVVTCDPDDVERDQGEYCDDCGQATKRSGLESLHYPVTVLYREI